MNKVHFKGLPLMSCAILPSRKVGNCSLYRAVGKNACKGLKMGKLIIQVAIAVSDERKKLALTTLNKH